MYTYLNFDKLFLSNHSEKFRRFSLQIRSVEVRSHRVNCARNVLRKSKRRHFSFSPPPYLQDRTTSNNSPSPGSERLDMSLELPGGDGNKSIGLFINVLANCRYIHVCCMEINTLPIRYLLWRRHLVQKICKSREKN